MLASPGVFTEVTINNRYEIRYLPGRNAYFIHDIQELDSDSYLDNQGISTFKHAEISGFASAELAIVKLTEWGKIGRTYVSS